jgi:superfamily II DNA or RNA helicase
MTEHRNILKLRPYQGRALREILERLNSSTGLGTLLVAPTGSGKTEIIAALLLRMPRHSRALVLQGLVDLVAQNAMRLEAFLGDRGVVALAASLPAKFPLRGDATQAGIVSGTVETILASLEHLGAFDVLIIDEAHHAVCGSYLRIVEELRKRNPALRLFGTTATPERSDRRGLDVLFGENAVTITMEELIRLGWLVPPRVMGLPLANIATLRAMQIEAEDIDKVMSRALNVQVVHDEVIRNWKLHGEDRQSIFFCCDVAHAEGLAEAFRAVGVDAEAVSHKTPPKKRMALLDKFRAGEGPKVITNPFLLTEGFDAPPASLIGLLRPFASKSTLIQAVGRGLRLWPGKIDCIVLDFVAATERHKNFIAGVNLKDRRRPALQPGEIGPIGGPGVPTVIGFGEADLEEFAVPGIPDVTFVRELEARPEKKRRYVDGKEVISRAEAMARGLDRYFTGKPCVNGHVAERIVAGECKACRVELEKERSGDPKRLASEIQRRRKLSSTPEGKARIRAYSRKKRQNPEMAERQKERDRQRWLDAEYREKARARQQTPEHKAKVAEWARKRRARLLAENPEAQEQLRAKWRGDYHRRRAERALAPQQEITA